MDRMNQMKIIERESYIQGTLLGTLYSTRAVNQNTNLLRFKYRSKRYSKVPTTNACMIGLKRNAKSRGCHVIVIV